MRRLSLSVIVLGLGIGCTSPTASPQQPASEAARLSSTLAEISPAKAGEKVKELYALIADAPIQVLSVVEDGHLYRVTFRVNDTEPQEQTVHVTRDGQYLIESISEIDTKYRTFADQKRFASCLRDKGVRILVNPQTREGQAALLPFGRFAKMVAINCAAAPENCKRLGAGTLPAVLYQDELQTGLKPVEWFETLTGCK